MEQQVSYAMSGSDIGCAATRRRATTLATKSTRWSPLKVRLRCSAKSTSQNRIFCTICTKSI